MTPKTNRLGSWKLFIKNESGKEVKAGRFLTDSAAFQFVEDYRISEWRMEGPNNQVAKSRPADQPRTSRR